jgi:diguanylate cyclase (GGDEF)-like protein
VVLADPDMELEGLMAAGVTHFLPWPCPANILAATLAAVEHEAPAADEDVETHDALTGLLNRGAAVAMLENQLSPAGGNGGGDNGPLVACMLIGISQFSSINTAYGKVAGDEVMARAAARIRRCAEELAGNRAAVARISGTEYLVILFGDGDESRKGVFDVSPGQEAEDFARLILSAVVRPFVAGDQVIRLTARCGIAEPAAGDDASSLLRRANAALSDARRSGTNDISVRSGSGRGATSARRGDADRLDADLRLALDRGDIGIVYQPQYDSFTDAIVGVEALARWNHPELGQLDAGTLFEAADRSDYLLPLSLHIQRAALAEAGKWPASLNGLRLSINVTAADLAQDDFVPALLRMVDESGFPHHRLTVEITETGLIENIDRAAVILQSLRHEGLWVAIDDFGTGYSSLAYLKSLHPDYLKIDHSLSRDILGTPRDRIILRAVIAMARSLALTVIVEGIENEQQLTLLAREGCQIYQGFLRSPPVTTAGLVDLVLKN